MTKKLLIFNWKNYLTSCRRADELVPLYLKLKRKNQFKIILAPPHPWLSRYLDFERASQDVSPFYSKEIIGEVLPIILKDLGVNYAIIGHSSRRINLKETDQLINQKLKNCLAAGLKPIFCLGENASQRKKNLTHQVLREQLNEGLKGIKISLVKQIIFVYEPVWAIYPQKPDTVSDAKEMINYLAELIFKLYKIRPLILYGGSVNHKNIAEFLAQKEINGLLIGYAGTNKIELEKIIKSL